MTFFFILFIIVVLQRLLEVVYARFNERRMKAQGAIEAGQEHYKWIVLLHVLFFLSLLMEIVYVTEGELAPFWPVALAVFVIAQVLRVWTLYSLGPFWSTKIIVLPGAKKVKRGPYRWLPHPNYLIVALEIASLPLIFGGWRTAIVFSIANALLLLLVRIPAEERALQQLKE